MLNSCCRFIFINTDIREVSVFSSLTLAKKAKKRFHQLKFPKMSDYSFKLYHTKQKQKNIVCLFLTSRISPIQFFFPPTTLPRTNHKCFPRPSDMTFSGTARVYHSDHPPSYTDTPACPHSWAASATWHAVTAEPHSTQTGRLRSTPARVKRAWSCSLGRKWPDWERKEWKGTLTEPGMWPGSVSVRQRERTDERRVFFYDSMITYIFD